MNDLSKDAIKKKAMELGANIVGIANITRFKNAPPGFHPQDLFPEGKSVIVIGSHFPASILETSSKPCVTNVYTTIFRLLDQISLSLSSFLAQHGIKALPVPADDPYTFWDEKKQHGCGEISHKHAAKLAGLGTIGKNSLLITKEFGNFVNLTSVIIDKSFKSDPLLKENLCIEHCDKCIKACPVNAIKEHRIVNQKKCRIFHSIKSKKGHDLVNCWECRRVCPAP